MLTLLCLVAIASPASISPVFETTSEGLGKSFDKGFTEAAKRRDAEPILKRTRKCVGRVKTGVFSEECVSWLTLLLPEQAAYVIGFNSKKKYLPQEEVDSLRSAILDLGKSKQDSVFVFCNLGLYPSWGASGKITRRADLKDLSDVRIVMKIGDKVYQPRAQPGTLTADVGSGSSLTVIPGTAYDSKGNAAFTYQQYASEGYSYYIATFVGLFDLYERDGTPRITSETKDFSFRVVYGANDREAKFTLAELEKAKP